MIRPNSEKCHIKGRPTTSDTVRPTSHNLQRRSNKQFTPESQGNSRIASIGTFGSSFTAVSWVGHVL